MVRFAKKEICCILLCCILITGCQREVAGKVKRQPAESGGVSQSSLMRSETEVTAKTLKQGSRGKKNTDTLHFFDAQGKKWYDITIDPKVKKHTYDWSCLKNKKHFVTYTGDNRYYLRRGVDVSHHQGSINWKKVKAAGYDFAFLRIGYRGYGQSGSLNKDRQFQKNFKAAKKAGMDVGVYFFSQAVNTTEALQEAAFVFKQLKGKKLELPVVYDPERILGASARTDSVSGKQFTMNTIAFCEKIKKAGYQPMIYSNMYWEAFLFDMEKLSIYPVWYADYKKVPQTPYEFTFWQYTSKGKVNGIAGTVDLNVWFCRR